MVELRDGAGKILFTGSPENADLFLRTKDKNTLLQAIQNTVLLGRSIKFDTEINQIKITIATDDKELSQFMPLHDHFTEQKLCGCIAFMNNKL